MATISELLYMKMDNGELIYGTNLDIGKYSVEHDCECEFIIDGGHGEGFCMGNILKYAQRYGKKNGYNRADLMKVLHYALMALYVHDTVDKNES